MNAVQPLYERLNLPEIPIVFMGTPEFAVASLHALIDAGCRIVAVVTAPDKPSGRGLKMNESAVKKYAIEKNLLVLQPEKLKDPGFLAKLESVHAAVQVVVAFRMLPEVVWNMPPYGTINLHASLLPQYRGAAPINWAVINGETETGVTTFKLQHQIDTGNILLAQKISIGANETAGELHDRMKEIGAAMLVTTLQKLAEGSLVETKQADQDPSLLKHAPKIFTETCKINWETSVDRVHNLIRGCAPFPGAFTSFDKKILKIYRSEKEKMDHDVVPGNYVTDNKNFLKFACPDGFIHLLELQPEAKKRMNVRDFLRGYRPQPG